MPFHMHRPHRCRDIHRDISQTLHIPYTYTDAPHMHTHRDMSQKDTYIYTAHTGKIDVLVQCYTASKGPRAYSHDGR